MVGMIISFFICLIATAASADVTVGPSFDISLALTSTNGQHVPRVAYGDGTYLVVWEEGWHSPPNHYPQVYAARVTVSGGNATVLDTAGIHLATSTNAQQRPKISYGNGVFLVVWQELRTATDYDIVGVTVTTAGTVSSAIDISSQPYNQIQPDLDYDATNGRFFVVWLDLRANGDNYQIYGSRITTGRTVSDPNGILMVTNANYLFIEPDIAISSDQILLGYVEGVGGNSNLDYMFRLFDLNGSYIKAAWPELENPWPLIGTRRTGGLNYGFWNIVSDGTDFMAAPRQSYVGKAMDVWPGSVFSIHADGTNPNYQYPLIIDSKDMSIYGDAAYVGDSGYISVFQSTALPGHDNKRAGYECEADADWNVYLVRISKEVTTCYDVDNRIEVAVDTTSAEITPAVATDGRFALVVWSNDNMTCNDVQGCEDTSSVDISLRASVVDLGTDRWLPSGAETTDGDDALPSASQDASVTQAGRSNEGCGCGLGEGRSLAGGLFTFMLVALLLRWRSRASIRDARAGMSGLRARREVCGSIMSIDIAPRFASGLFESIEQDRRTSSASSRIWRLRV